jgi:hypothetical protein
MAHPVVSPGITLSHRALLYDRRDGALVDHLQRGVFKQYEKLVEGFNAAAQLDPVDEVKL